MRVISRYHVVGAANDAGTLNCADLLRKLIDEEPEWTRFFEEEHPPGSDSISGPAYCLGSATLKEATKFMTRNSKSGETAIRVREMPSYALIMLLLISLHRFMLSTWAAKSTSAN